MTATLQDRACAEYVARLQAEADEAANLACELSVAYFTKFADMTPDERLSLMESADAAARKRDAWRQQIDYYTHRTNMPAWRD